MGCSPHRQVQNHFTPTSFSWLNLVEPWFGGITRKRIRRGSFNSVGELVAPSQKFIRHNNEKGLARFAQNSCANGRMVPSFEISGSAFPAIRHPEICALAMLPRRQPWGKRGFDRPRSSHVGGAYPPVPECQTN
jgi:hypothetical protein